MLCIIFDVFIVKYFRKLPTSRHVLAVVEMLEHRVNIESTL